MSINILNPTGADIFIVFGVILLVDLAYAVFRSAKWFPAYGWKGRALEAVLITTPVTWWFLNFAESTPESVAALILMAVYGVVAIALAFVFSTVTDRMLYPPILAGWVLTIPTILGLFFLEEIVEEFVPGSYIPIISFLEMSLYGLVMAFVAYKMLGFIDSGREEDEFGPYSDRLSPLSNEPLPAKSVPGPSSDSHDSTTPPSRQKKYHHKEVGMHSSEQESHRARPTFSDLSYDWRYSETSFDDIGGYYELKTALDEDVLKPLRAAQTGDDRYSRFDIEPERGILLYGPPGTGKTMFARALAGELDIPFVELSPADVTSMWVNESSDQIKTLFDEADKIGQCIVFLDEAEHLFGARDHTGKSAHAEDRKVTSEFLAQLTRDDREAIVVSATNRPGDIDRAILRPGRLTAHFEVGLPDDEARHAILEAHLNGIPSTVSDQELATLADRTEGLTGADLANLVEQARRSAAHRNAEAVTRDDFPPEEVLDELSAELASENETGELPESEDSSDTETAELPEAKAGVRADDGESDSKDNGPTRGYQ